MSRWYAGVDLVAPRAGARIETRDSFLRRPECKESPPVRGRGLKQSRNLWQRRPTLSPPVRGRGLKRCKHTWYPRTPESPPVRGRGLKPHVRNQIVGAASGRPPCGGAD